MATKQLNALNPRNFKEKIELLKKKEAASTANFAAAIRDAREICQIAGACDPILKPSLGSSLLDHANVLCAGIIALTTVAMPPKESARDRPAMDLDSGKASVAFELRFSSSIAGDAAAELSCVLAANRKKIALELGSKTVVALPVMMPAEAVGIAELLGYRADTSYGVP
ncbi:hypothetical protein X801_07735 [Opisthorchis viverrini]|uniref:Uncharacterized protein n=1 Tax=Opisthorchis viverrini TaxID=6198 RepID=A0A1S8WPY4_OPIVI|nr:hypothetical protein X801_07735 [Opisthorchis viverrini]